MVDVTERCVHLFTARGPGGYADVRRAVASETITAGALGGLAVAVTGILGPA